MNPCMHWHVDYTRTDAEVIRHCLDCEASGGIRRCTATNKYGGACKSYVLEPEAEICRVHANYSAIPEGPLCGICGGAFRVIKGRPSHQANHRARPDLDGFCNDCALPTKKRFKAIGHVWDHVAEKE